MYKRQNGVKRRAKRQRKKRVNNTISVAPRQSTTVLNANTGVPDRAKVTLSYHDTFTMTPGAPRGNWIFRGNSVYDPDYTSTGHQPRYFDQYMAIYSKYRVLSSRIVVESSSYSGNNPSMFVVVPDTDPISFTSYSQASEMPRARSSAILSIASRLSRKVVHNMSTRTILGLGGPEIWDEDYSGTVATNPTNMWYWNIYVQSLDSTTNVSNGMIVRIEYTVLFYDRQYISDSVKVKLPDVPNSRELKSSPAPDIAVDVYNNVFFKTPQK